MKRQQALVVPATFTEKAPANQFSERLLNWFDLYGRKDLPWQQNKTPYRVWVSEIMLQQTQVSSVIGYYQGFMSRFPRLEILANAEQDEVLHHWAGLGYYARARNLLKSAKIIQHELNGCFPNTLDKMIALPGIGRSTAGAILSIAFNQRVAILDGNVKRVLCRYRAIPTWPGDKQTEDALWQLADTLTPSERVSDYTQAIMDLGATLCRRSKPNCLNCPLASDCQALAQDLQNALPVSRPKKNIPLKHTWMVHIESDDGYILLEKRPPSGIWGGLYSLPELDSKLALSSIAGHCSERFGSHCNTATEQTSFIHTFSHYKLNIKPVTLRTTTPPRQIRNNDNYRWIRRAKIKELGMPSPVFKYLQQMIQPTIRPVINFPIE